jgi:hypothetical protein
MSPITIDTPSGPVKLPSGKPWPPQNTDIQKG